MDNQTDIRVRDVTMDHLEQVAPLWEQAWRASGRRRTTLPMALSMDRLRRRVEVAEGGGYRFLAVWLDGVPVGIATVSLTDGGPMLDAPGVHIHVLHVSDAHRNRGAGSALLGEVADWATSLGSEQIVVDVAPASRDVQRWYARWGFGPYLNRRVAPTTVILRKLGRSGKSRGVPAGRRRIRASRRAADR